MDHWVLREGQQPPKARPGGWKTPQWRAEGRGTLGNQGAHYKGSAFWRATPSMFVGGKEMEGGLPGASNNTGGESRLFAAV